MLPSEIERIGLLQEQNTPWIFTDREDILYNNRTKELFYHSCIDGALTLYRKVTDIDDLKQALYDGFPSNRYELNLD